MDALTAIDARLRWIRGEQSGPGRAQHGKGEWGRRADRAWAATVPCGTAHDVAVLGAVGDDGPAAVPDAGWQVRFLVEQMIKERVVTFEEARLVCEAASAADLLRLPRRRRAGLTAPVASDLRVMLHPEGAHTVRRRLGELLDRFADYVRGRFEVAEVVAWLDAQDEPPLDLWAYLYAADDPDRVWAAAHFSDSD